MSEQPAVRTMPTTYTVTAMPDSEPEGASWWILVEWIGPREFGRPRPADQQWTIRHLHGAYLDRDGAWERPPGVQDDRYDAWRVRHRFGLDEALRLAQEAAPKVVVGGVTAAEAIEWRRQQQAKEGER